MNQQRTVADLLERRTKRRQQIGWQCANKSDRVVDDNFLFAWQTQPSRGRIEGGEHPLLGMHVAFCERIEQSGLSGVGVADNGDHRQSLPRSSFAALLPALSLCLDLAFETINAIANAAAISFEFCFARTPTADAAGQT